MIRSFLAATLIFALPACAKSDATSSSAQAAQATEENAETTTPGQFSAAIVAPDGTALGLVFLNPTPNGVLLSASLTGLPEGEHAFHIHAKGTCAPDFGAAGGHFAPNSEPHGFKVDGGPHAGDMPNIYVPASGDIVFETFNPRVSLFETPNALFDEDGSAIMIHAGPDDYESQPSGAAGSRIGCGVISQTNG